jgi:uncharacterized glyoxalase superfamily protein PhnB
MAFREAFPIIYSDDVDRLARFYIDAFRFELTFRWPPEESAPLEFGNLRLGSSSIGIGSPIGPLHGKPAAASGNPATFELCIETDDVDEAVTNSMRCGATLVREPVDEPWDERMAYIADPDGHPIMLFAKRT